MQTTLLGLAIAIILALVAALVAPLVVDWNRYRTAFENEASRLTGLSVRVTGTIDARILPTPRIKLRNVEIGEAGHEPRLRAGSLDLAYDSRDLIVGGCLLHHNHHRSFLSSAWILGACLPRRPHHDVRSRDRTMGRGS